MTTKRTDPLQDRIDKLTGTDFMMMDIHRPLTLVEKQEVCPQAVVDHTEEPPRYSGPFVKYPENVEVLDVNTSHELEVERVLQSAYDNKLETVLVIGQRPDGEIYFLCSDPALAEANLLCDLAKIKLMDAIKDNCIREDPRGPEDRA